MLYRKDFRIIAGIIDKGIMRPTKGTVSLNATILAERLADYLATKNPEFDRVKFMTACGIT